MKKIFLSLALFILTFTKVDACLSYDLDFEYYNLFMQELISDPQYYPFLRTVSNAFYQSNDSSVLKNENIEEWQNYLGVKYNEAYYLVYKSARTDIQKLINNKKITDAKLSFANSNFVLKHKQALYYLSYAKYLEPYMNCSGSDNSWEYQAENTIAKLDFNKITNVLIKSWSAETDKELKLRYGYQLVRFAHYKGNFTKSIKYFNQYVESLKFRPAMYYYALDQMAGAQNGLKQSAEANYNFCKVFTHSRNLKESAFNSMKFTDKVNYSDLLKRAKNNKEKNDIYLLMGYLDFNNPLPSLKSIVANDPDAIQAKVLMARTINNIERNNLPINYSDYSYTNFRNNQDKRLPLIGQSYIGDFYTEILEFSKKMANNTLVTDKSYWNLTTAFLCYLEQDYAKAKTYLANTEEKNELYKTQKNNLEISIYISEQPSITDKVEKTIYARFGSSFENLDKSRTNSSTFNFLTDVLANRYFLQKDYGKSFLMNNNIPDLENNPRLDLLDAIEKFYFKSSKNKFEEFIAQRIFPSNGNTKVEASQFMLKSYINNMRGTIYLSEENLELALKSFQQVDPAYHQSRFQWDSNNGIEYKAFDGEFNGYSGISRNIFSLSKIECFNCEENKVMPVKFTKRFSDIKPTMNKLELTQTLLKLKSVAKSRKKTAAEANFLLGNFYYNTTNLGYFRHILRFDSDNSHCAKYDNSKEKDIYKNIYLKNYSWETYFVNNFNRPDYYYQAAYKRARNRELKAQIAFALSKCEQADFQKLDYSDISQDIEKDGILIKNRRYFAELKKYSNTNYYKEVKSNCLYFDYYISHY